MRILPEHKEILLTQSKSKTLLQWVQFFDFQYTKNQIYSFCYQNNVIIKKEEPDQTERKYHIKQDYFKTWSRNMAYVLGLWFADGYIYGDKIFDITLHAKDKYILKKVAEELRYEGKLYDYVDNQAARLNFSCVVIYNDLFALSRTFPDVPKEYLNDFVRGYFDGKGSAMDLKNNRFNTAFTCDSEEFLDKLLLLLQEECGVKGGSYDKNSKSLKFGKKDSILIGQFMYRNNPELFLLRKRNKFLKYMKEEN